MAGRRLTITLDEPLLDALHGEGSRTCEPASRVAERVLRAALPAYVEAELRRDLSPTIRARVVDVRSTPVSDPSDAATPSALTEGATSDPSPKTFAEQNCTARHHVEGASGGSPA